MVRKAFKKCSISNALDGQNTTCSGNLMMSMKTINLLWINHEQIQTVTTATRTQRHQQKAVIKRNHANQSRLHQLAEDMHSRIVTVIRLDYGVNVQYEGTSYLHVTCQSFKVLITNQKCFNQPMLPGRSPFFSKCLYLAYVACQANVPFSFIKCSNFKLAYDPVRQLAYVYCQLFSFNVCF